MLNLRQGGRRRVSVGGHTPLGKRRKGGKKERGCRKSVVIQEVWDLGMVRRWAGPGRNQGRVARTRGGRGSWEGRSCRNWKLTRSRASMWSTRAQI